jgi:hypothetical protein
MSPRVIAPFIDASETAKTEPRANTSFSPFLIRVMGRKPTQADYLARLQNTDHLALGRNPHREHFFDDTERRRSRVAAVLASSPPGSAALRQGGGNLTILRELIQEIEMRLEEVEKL